MRAMSICTQTGPEMSYLLYVYPNLSHEYKVIGREYKFMLVKDFEVFYKVLSIRPQRKFRHIVI